MGLLAKTFTILSMLFSLSSCVIYYEGDIGSLILDPALIAYYPFNGDATDHTGNGHDAVTSNTVLTTNRFGSSGRAYLFNGTNSYIEVPAGVGINLSDSSFTVAFWYKQNTSGNDRVFAHSDGGGAYIDIYLDGGSFINFIVDDGMATAVVSTVSSTVGSWHHLAAVLDGNKLQIYINGSLDNELVNGNSFVQYSGNYQVIIGDSLSFNKSFDGVLDDIFIYNRALTADEVNQIYNLSE